MVDELECINCIKPLGSLCSFSDDDTEIRCGILESLLKLFQMAARKLKLCSEKNSN